MSKLSNLLEASDRVQLPAQDRYEFAASKASYFLKGIGLVFLALFLGYLFINQHTAGLASEQTRLLAYAIPAVVFAMGLIFILGALPAKVILDDEGMNIPGILPFMREKLAWNDIEKAELTPVVYSSKGFFLGLVISLFESLLTQLQLCIIRNGMSSSKAAEYAILARVQNKDKAMALRIVREKLGDRFTLY